MKATYRYTGELQIAIRNAKRLGLTVKGNLGSRRGPIVSNDVRVQVQVRIAEYYSKNYRGNLVRAGLSALNVHLDNLDWIRANIDPLAEVVAGYVTTPKGTAFKFTFDEARRLYGEGLGKNERRAVNMHAWISLSSAEIIDLTLGLAISSARGLDIDIGALPIILGYPENRFFESRYHPVVYGAAFLEKIEAHTLVNHGDIFDRRVTPTLVTDDTAIPQEIVESAARVLRESIHKAHCKFIYRRPNGEPVVVLLKISTLDREFYRVTSCKLSREESKERKVDYEITIAGGFMARLIAIAEVCSQIMDPKRERAAVLHSIADLTPLKKDFASFGSYYGLALQTFADFVVSHEIAHIVNGHLDLAAHKVVKNITVAGVPLQKALEHDADFSAARHSVEAFLQGLLRYEQDFNFASEAQVWKDFGYLLFTIFQMLEWWRVKTDGRIGDYPTMLDRCLMAALSAAAYCEEKFGIVRARLIQSDILRGVVAASNESFLLNELTYRVGSKEFDRQAQWYADALEQAGVEAYKMSGEFCSLCEASLRIDDMSSCEESAVVQ